MTLSDLERRDATVNFFFTRISVITIVQLTKYRTKSGILTLGEGRILGVSPAPVQRELLDLNGSNNRTTPALHEVDDPCG